MIQYGSRFLMHALLYHPETSNRFRSLFENMRDARKLFRLFKFVVEIRKLEQLLQNASKQPDEFSLLLQIGARVGYFGYWLFDNLLIMSKIKLLKKDPSTFNKPAMFFWTIANLCNVWHALHSLKRVKREKGYILDRIHEDQSKKIAFAEKLRTLKVQSNQLTR